MLIMCPQSTAALIVHRMIPRRVVPTAISLDEPFLLQSQSPTLPLTLTLIYSLTAYY